MAMNRRVLDEDLSWAMDAPEQPEQPAQAEREQGAEQPPKAPLPETGGDGGGAPEHGHGRVCQSFFMVEPGALLVLPEYGGGNRVVHIRKRCVLFCAEADDGTLMTPEWDTLHRYADAECRGAGGMTSISLGGREGVPRPPQMQDFP